MKMISKETLYEILRRRCLLHLEGSEDDIYRSGRIRVSDVLDEFTRLVRGGSESVNWAVAQLQKIGHVSDGSYYLRLLTPDTILTIREPVDRSEWSPKYHLVDYEFGSGVMGILDEKEGLHRKRKFSKKLGYRI